MLFLVNLFPFHHHYQGHGYPVDCGLGHSPANWPILQISSKIADFLALSSQLNQVIVLNLDCCTHDSHRFGSAGPSMKMEPRTSYIGGKRSSTRLSTAFVLMRIYLFHS